MDITYSFGDSILVRLDAHETERLYAFGFESARGGIYGHCSSVLVQTGDIDRALAQVDGNADMTITVPHDPLQTTAIIQRSEITGFGKNREARLNHFFGSSGSVILFFSTKQ